MGNHALPTRRVPLLALSPDAWLLIWFVCTVWAGWLLAEMDERGD